MGSEYWYNYALALFKLHDCEMTYALARYWSLCVDGADCAEKYRDWARTVVVGSLWHTSCWPPLARAVRYRGRILLGRAIRAIIDFVL